MNILEIEKMVKAYKRSSQELAALEELKAKGFLDCHLFAGGFEIQVPKDLAKAILDKRFDDLQEEVSGYAKKLGITA